MSDISLRCTLSKIFGLITLSPGVQFILSGIKEAFPKLMQRGQSRAAKRGCVDRIPFFVVMSRVRLAYLLSTEQSGSCDAKRHEDKG